MLKFMNNRYGQSRIFMEADKGGGSGGSSGSNDDSGDESGSDDDPDDKADDDEGGDDDPDADEKKFSQKDVDAAVKKQLEKEKRKWQREQKKKESKKPAGKDTSDGGAGETDTNSDELKAERAKTSGLEMKLACFEAGVAKDSVSDVAALAKSYMEADEDLDLEDAIEKVVEKYPQFKDGSDDDDDDSQEKKKGWGQRHGKPPKKATTMQDEIRARMFGK